ncbi:MAG: methionine ABC transporter ATP-binding protein [Enterococcus sp.]
MIELNNISVTFHQKEKEIHAVQAVNLTVSRGDVFGIVGYSGAGKSTLVRVINLLQKPTSGTVRINDRDITELPTKQLRKARQNIGMIFQHFNLMNSRTIFDNVDFSLKYKGISKQERHQRVTELLTLVGLSDKAKAYPSQLSGGQKQRVAIARALANDPDILLCDEATSALDPKTTVQILNLLKKLNQQLNLTIVLITHEMQVVKEICNKVAIMEDGKIIEQGPSVEIFSRPEKEVTRDFIRTATHIDEALEIITNYPEFAEKTSANWLVELSYIGDQTNEPLIAQLYSKYQVTANILYGTVELIQHVPLGSLIVTLSGEKNQKEQALAFLKQQGVSIHILQENKPQTAIHIVEGGI